MGCPEVREIISKLDNIIRMIVLSENSIPAVQAIGRRLIPLMPRDKDLTECKMRIGRMVQKELEHYGWIPVGKGRVAAGHLFSTGAIYAPKEPRTSDDLPKETRINDDLRERVEGESDCQLEEPNDDVTDEPQEELGRWSQRERQRLTAIRNRLFNDPGGGLFRDIPRQFVLSIPTKNLWAGIRADAIDYFARNRISWWGGNNTEPTGHMLSSQVACVNHLYLLRQRADLARAVLRAVDPEVEQAEIVDDGYVEFEFIGEKPYFKEQAFTRGAKCTSVDAFMIGRTARGCRRAFLIEWKYTEVYQQKDVYICRRAKVYDDLIKMEESPFKMEESPFKQIEPRAFYFEPFYQMMRQTLLGWQISKHEDHGCTSWRHIHVVPAQNVEFCENVTSETLRPKGATVSQAWSAVLKNPEFYIETTPQVLMQPILDRPDTKALTGYLEQRYWSAI
jgi:hypothetical protein